MIFMIFETYIKKCSYFCSEIEKNKWKFSNQTINNNDDDSGITIKIIVKYICVK